MREIAADHDGLFTAGEAKQAGVSQPVIVQLAARGRLKRLSRGLYAFPTWPTTTHRQYHEAVLWPQAHRELEYALISYDSALELYGLTQLNPGVVHVTLPPQTRISRLPPDWITVHFERIPAIDRTFETGVPVVSFVRAIEESGKLHGLDLVHRAVTEARERRMLREDELERLVSVYGSVILQPYHAT